MNFTFGKNKRDKSLSGRVNTTFSQEEEYSLAVVITILKHRAIQMWGLPESSEILESIASLRECFLEQNELSFNISKLSPSEASRETSNAVFKLGQTATTFNLLCEKNGYKSPLIGLKGHEVTTELCKLAKLDKAFYGNKDAFVATEELIKKKQYSDPSDAKDGFASKNTQYKFTNIKLYDTIILLKVLASKPGELSSHINILLDNLEDAVARRKSLETKKEQCIEFISKNKEVEKNLRILKTTEASIEDLGRKLGSLEVNLETIAISKNLPNAFSSEMDTKEVWESLANMFEVLNQSRVEARRDEDKYAVQTDAEINVEASENV